MAETPAERADRENRERLRQLAITRRQEQRSARGMDATTAAIFAAWESEGGLAPPVDIQIQEPTGATLGEKIAAQRRKRALPEPTTPPAVNLEDAQALERQFKQVGNFSVAPGGAPWAQRLETGIKKTELGQFNNLVERYGEDNVTELYGNDNKSVVGFAVRNAPDQPWQRFDPPVDKAEHGGGILGTIKSIWADLTGDIADVAGPAALEAAPGAVLSGAGGAVGGLGGAMVGGAVGDAIGTVARDAVAERIPGEEDQEQIENGRAYGKDVALNVVAGLASEALPLGGRILATPTRQIARRVAKESAFDPIADAAIREGAEDVAEQGIRGADEAAEIVSASARRPTTDVIPERQALGQRTGVDFSGGQLSGSRSMLQREDALANVEKYADQIGDAKMIRIRQLDAFLRKTLDAAGGGRRADSLDAGTATSAGYKAYTEALDDARKEATRGKFADADKALGGYRLHLQNFVSTAERLAAGETKGTTGPMKALYGGLRDLVEKYAEDPTANASGLSALLSEWGKAAQGEALEAFKDADPRRARRVAAALFGALNKDLDNFAAGGGFARSRVPYGQKETGDWRTAAAKLKDARDTFRDLSAPINDAQNRLLRNAVKLDEAGHADTIGATLVQSKSPSEIRNAMRILNKADPEAARMAFSDALGSLVEKAPAGTADANQAGVSTSIARFASVGRANRKKVAALVAGLGDSGEAREVLSMWNDAIRAAEIITDSGLPPGSQTASRLFNAGEEASGVLKDAKSGGITGVLAGQVERMKKGPRINGQKLADIASDPVERDKFTALVQQMSTAGGRLAAEAKSPRAHAEAWFRAAVQTGLIEIRDSRNGAQANDIDRIREERARNRPTPVIAGDPYQ